MWLYLTIFFIPVIIYLSNPKGGKNASFLAFILFFLAFFVGLTDMFGGYDRYIYAELFDSLADDTHAGKNPFQSEGFKFYESEFGYGTLCVIISLFTRNRYIFILIITLIFYFLLYQSLKKYTTNYPYAIILFFGLWFYFSFTYLRQILGVVVCWYAIEYAIKHNVKSFFLIVLFAATIHNSALVFLPVYFLAQKKFTKTQVMRIMVVCLLIGLTNMSSALQSIYGSFNTATGHHDEDAIMGNAEGSFRIAYAVEALFFLYIILSNYHRFSNSKKRTVLLNMALMFCAILLLFIRSENGGRISWYYMIGPISTITYIVHKKGTNPIFAKILIVICLFLYVRIYNAWQIFNNLYPYKTFLTNGHRKPDYSYEHYEYDPNYDKDKFYR